MTVFVVKYDVFENGEKKRKSVVFKFQMDADKYIEFMGPHNSAVMEEVQKAPSDAAPINPAILEGAIDQSRNRTFDSDILHGDRFPEYCKGIDLHREIVRKPKNG